MNDYAFGLKVGFAQVGSGTVDNPTYVQGAANLTPAQLAQYGLVGTGGCLPTDRRCHTPARRGLNLALPIQLGGAGVGFRLEPYMTLSSSAKAYGVYTGPTFVIHLARPLYLGFGLGFKAAWVRADPWKYAGDLFGSIPIEATYYVADDFAFVLDFSFGAGASAYVGELKDVINPLTGARIARKSDVTFGLSRIWDLGLGVRFP